MIIEKRSSSKKIQILSYLFMTYLFSWSIWGILYASSKSIISFNIYGKHGTLFIVLGGFMPSIMSIFFTGFFYGREGIKELLRKLTIWKANPLFYLLALFFTALIICIPIWICNVTGDKYKIYIYANFYETMIIFISTLLIGGPLGEELGWRGYVLPKLQSKLNPIFSSLILGVVWACWHLPLFFIYGSSQYGTSFVLFILVITLVSILYTWLYNRTHGSLIFVILLHASWNTTPAIISIHRQSIYPVKYLVISYLVPLVMGIFVILDMIKKSKDKFSTNNSTKLET